MSLELKQISVTIQSSPILRSINLSVGPGQRVGLIGRNGAGKTTVMRTIAGLARPVAGEILFDGQPINKLSPDQRAGLGFGYMPEDRRLVPLLSVEENMLLPSWANKSIDGATRIKMVYELMPELVEMKARKALQLSGGQQKLVALGRALIAGSRLLYLDEPFEGVAPALSRRLTEVIASLQDQKLSILIAQSELNHANKLLDQECLIERGEIIRTTDVGAAV
ncbi:MAG: ABC transporter ATP-binding protein [Burkholderiaceae bacterium]